MIGKVTVISELNKEKVEIVVVVAGAVDDGNAYGDEVKFVMIRKVETNYEMHFSEDHAYA